MYKVLLAPGAKNELFEAVTYIKRKLRNPPAAARLADEAKAVLLNLRTMPERYPYCEDPVLRVQGYRRAPVARYLLVFRITRNPNQVRVVHFFHETQDYLMTLQTGFPDP